MKRTKDILLLIGISILLLAIGVLMESLVSWSPWVLLIPVLLFFAAVLFNYLKRLFFLRRHGFFIRCNNEQNHRLIYEEKHGDEIRSVLLKTVRFEPGRDHVVVPTREDWDREAPEWAKGRRDEIFTRIIKMCPKGWVELPEDWTG